MHKMSVKERLHLEKEELNNALHNLESKTQQLREERELIQTRLKAIQAYFAVFEQSTVET